MNDAFRDRVNADQLASSSRAAPNPYIHRTILAAKLGLAAAVIAWLCTGPLDLREVARIPFSLNLLLLVLIVAGSMLIPAIRWWWLLRVQQIDCSLWQATKLTWAGYATSLFLPGAAGGDLARCYLIVRHQTETWTRCLSTVFVDRAIGVYSLIMLGGFSAAWFLAMGQPPPAQRALSYLLFALLAGATLAISSVLVPSVRRLLARFVPSACSRAASESHQLYAQSKTTLVGCLVLSLLSNVLTVLSLAAADRALGGAVKWADCLIVGPLVVLVNCAPFTPGGVGVAEATASELFQQFRSANGAEMMLTMRLVTATLALPGLLIVFALKRRSGSTGSNQPPNLEGSTKSIRNSPPARAA